MPVASVIPGAAGPLPSAAPWCGMVLADSHDQRLLLRELGPVYNRELRLLVNPLDKHVRPLGRWLATPWRGRKRQTSRSCSRGSTSSV